MSPRDAEFLMYLGARCARATQTETIELIQELEEQELRELIADLLKADEDKTEYIQQLETRLNPFGGFGAGGLTNE